MLRFARSANVTAVKKWHQQSSRFLQGLVVGLPKEVAEGEHRVALTPANVTKLTKSGAKIKIEGNAGALSGYTDRY